MRELDEGQGDKEGRRFGTHAPTVSWVMAEYVFTAVGGAVKVLLLRTAAEAVGSTCSVSLRMSEARRENWLFCGPSVQCISDVPPMCRSVSHSFSCSHLLLGLPLPYILMWKG